MAENHDGSTISDPFLEERKNVGDASDEETALTADPTSTKTVTFFRTCLNGLNALSGIGILSLPYALAAGGWLSLILLFGVALTAYYSGILIKRCMDTNCSIRTYPDIGDLAFGKGGRLVISLCMNVELYLVAAGFLILEGDNLDNLFPNTKIEMCGLAISGKKLFIILVGLIIMPTVWLDDLSLLSYVSASGVIASAIIISSVFYTAISDESIGFHGKGTLLNWEGIPTAVSLYAFCYCAHPVFSSLYNSMRNRRRFSSVLLVCFVLSTAGNAFIAIVGYLMFGSDVESQITLNLPKDKLSSKVAIYTTLVNPVAKYALMLTPVKNALKGLLPPRHNNRFTSILISTALVLSTITVAVAIPLFGSLTSLVGAFLSVTASIVLPCACYLKISGTHKVLGFETVVIVTIIFLGVVIAILGTSTSLLEIVENF